ncbi:MAG: 2-C-methyl-D-erythritol 4-phosphate cytidylyltransferase [Cyclobacteriaceae bacterium]|nr:2-C-methyl-D-erythritol 4-phosphate cytidylyltransferase [Cyclobacteriaceae bacterium]
MKKYALIVAGGSGNRMGSTTPKQFLLLENLPILMHTISQFQKAEKEIELIVVLPKDQIDTWNALCKEHNFTIKHSVVEGGATRFDSVKNGLSMVGTESLVAIHDGVRPLVSTTIILNSFKEAEQSGSAVVAVPLKESIRKKENQTTVSKNRSDYYLVQTPQTFQSTLIKEYYQQIIDGAKFTDDASVFESQGGEINLVEGDYKNLKITTPEDLVIAQALLNNNT